MKNMKSLVLLASCGLLLAGCKSDVEKNDTPEVTTESSANETSAHSSVEETEASEEAEESGNFVKNTDDAYFDGTVLKGNTYSIKITDHKVIPVGEKGNEYGEAPVLAFWYDTLVSPDYDEENAIDPTSAWIMNFTAVQDNDPNMINELDVASLPDDQYLDSQMAEIKPGGTVSNAIAYELSDEETPVTLTAESMLGDDFGSFEFEIK